MIIGDGKWVGEMCTSDVIKFKVFRLIRTGCNEFSVIMKAKWCHDSLGYGTWWRYLENVEDEGHSIESIAKYLTKKAPLGSNLLRKSPKEFSKAISIFDLPEKYNDELISIYESFNRTKQIDNILIEKQMERNNKGILNKLSEVFVIK